MKKYTIKDSLKWLFGFFVLSSIGCKKDYINPSAATDQQVFSSARGLTGVATGLQRVYSAGRASSLYNVVTADAFLTNQVSILNQGNTAEYQLFLGAGSVDGTNTILGGLWTSSNKIIYDADLVITNAENLADKPFASGLIGYASIFKALAIGNMAMFWEKVPEGIGANINFIDRVDGFNQAIATIDKALAAMNANAVSPAFLSNIPAGVDIMNTLNALKARYSLFAGNYAQALTAANAVDLTKKSTLNYDAINLNPLFETVTSTNNVYAVIDSVMGLPATVQPDVADQRVPFYISTNASAPRFRVKGFGGTTTSSYPLYLPGEITLIKAEAYARQNQLPEAVTELNKILTKAPASDPFGVGANLTAYAGPVTQADVLLEIYRQRRIELFMSGLSLEDMRRFERPNTERKRNFFPYPFRERDNNPNTPADPAF
jgi:hypothetical protein